jgi:CubicO group peptidase (beta-lactamase class C family)
MVRKLWVISLVITLSLGLYSCTFVRFFWWNYADINDQYKFPSVPVHTAGQAFQFHQTNTVVTPFVPGLSKDCTFEQLLTDNKTMAFLIIRNDTMIYEKYFEDMTPGEAFPSFSVSKAFVGSLAGIAIAEGKIAGTHKTITDYLPWMDKPGFEKIRLEDLLNMRSGIKYKEEYNTPFAEMPRYYYSKNLKHLLTKLKVAQAPDLQYDYISVNTLLLGLAIEKAVEKPLNQYLEEKLWIPMAMESDANWNTDSRKQNTIKSFCCINARARDFARYGRLYLHKGEWQGKQLIPRSWVERTMSVVNDSKDSEGFAYTYCWRVTPKGAIYAKGILGQYIYVYPKKNIVIVRLGKKQGNVSWAKTFEKMVDYL